MNHRYAATLVAFTYGIYAFDRGIMSVLIQPLAVAFALDDAQMGLLSGLAYGVSFAVLCMPMGMLVDRVDRRLLLAVIVAVWSGMTLLSGFATSFATLVLCRVLVGAAEAGGGSASISLMSDIFPPERRTWGYGLLYLGSGIGSASSAIVGGIVAQHYGWHAAFFVAGVPGLITALLLWRTMAEPPRTKVAFHTEGRKGAALRFILSQRSLVWVYIGVPLAGAAMTAVSAWTVPYLTRFHDMELAQAGLTLGLLSGFGVCVGGMTSGIIADYLNRKSRTYSVWFIVTVLALSMPCAWMAFTVQNLVVCIGFLMATYLLFAFFMAPALALIIALVPPQLRGVAASVRDIVIFLVGFGFAPYVVGVLSVGIGGPNSLRIGIIVTILVCAALAIGAFLMATRSLQRDLAVLEC